ncbi:hypothetical protein [Rhizobium sp. NZLR11]|nr:hypothetical protein [Rhizobium sp. NZLR11]
MKKLLYILAAIAMVFAMEGLAAGSARPALAGPCNPQQQQC